MCAFYTSAVKTNVIDPRVDINNNRCEWRFDKDAVYLSNMRLANLGVTGTNDDYNFASGVCEVIQSIHLYDGSTMLDQVLDFGRWMSFKNYNKENASNRAVNNYLNLSIMGYEVRGLDGGGLGAITSRELASTKGVHQYNTTLATTERGWLDLKSVLPMLQSMLYMPTSVFKNLRLVIQYKSDVAVNQATTAPILIADTMEDDQKKSQMEKSFKGLEWVAIESDKVNFNAVSPEPAAAVGSRNPEEKVVKQIKGFNNKHLVRVLCMKQPNGADASEWSAGLSSFASMLFKREKSNISVNGRTMLVGDGLDTPNKALSSVTDVWGTCNAYLNQQFLPADDKGNNILDTNLNAMLGNQDYRAFMVDERVEQMEYVFGRTGEYEVGLGANQAHGSSNMPFILHCWGEVRKVMDVRPDGSYIIAYA